MAAHVNGRTASRVAWSISGLAIAFLLASQVFRAFNRSVPTPADLKGNEPVFVLAFVMASLIGALIASRRPENPIGWILLGAGGFVGGVMCLVHQYAAYTLLARPSALPAGAVAAWVGDWVEPSGFGPSFTLLLLLFPNGRLLSPRWGIVGRLAATVTAMLCAGFALLPGPLRYFGSVDNPFGIEAARVLDEPLSIALFATWLLFLALALASAGSLILRFRRARGDERQQIKWLASAAALLMVVVLLTAADDLVPGGIGIGPVRESLWAFVACALIASIGVAVLKYRLYAIDLLINRTLVYGALTACVVGLYMLVVGGLGTLFAANGSPLVALLATGLVAALFQPLRARLQRGVDRLLYGARPDPYQEIARLGGRLEETLADLRQSRAQLIGAREVERRRLRRDLHDGLGPALGAQTLKAGAARALLTRDPAAADVLLAGLEDDLHGALADVRRLVYDLRPPALDQLGLAGAVREAAQQYHLRGAAAAGAGGSSADGGAVDAVADGLAVTVDVPERLPPLPAAVEVAAYRIVQEALANVVRHARARTCTIRLALTTAAAAAPNGPTPPEDAPLGRQIAAPDALVMVVADDGVGLPPGCRAGVGMASMRERAAELGGTCVVAALPSGGTRVAARLPLSASAPPAAAGGATTGGHIALSTERPALRSVP
jgi:signal transduction histidine kinase